ncbi:unnamed protein product, partial [Phaeothamnion confervicola]
KAAEAVAELRRLLLAPGADVVVVDEAHLLKNNKAKTCLALKEVATKRRIAMTGSPLQNNLKELWCVVDWVRPGLLGSIAEFDARFIVPIDNGMLSDSTNADVLLMKKRCFVLHGCMEGFVHRRDITPLSSSCRTSAKSSSVSSRATASCISKMLIRSIYQK